MTIPEGAPRPSGTGYAAGDVLDLFARARHAGAMALRDEMVSAISFVLRLRISKRLQRALGVREAADAPILAEQIVAHLERCRFRFSQDGPPTSHSTPGARSNKENPPSAR